VSAASLLNRRLVVLVIAAAVYVGVFAGLAVCAGNGLGLGHCFYVPICLVALVTDTVYGTLAGVAAAGLYPLAVILAPGPTPHLLTESSVVRLVTYTLVGALVGWYASANRTLVARLRDHATHDFLTALGNARVFDEELARRCRAGRAFTLVLADMDDLKRVNDTHGHEAGNAALRRVAEVLRDHTGFHEVVARVGGDEFAIVTELPRDRTALLCARISRALAAEDLHLSFGTTAYPQDGTSGVELFRKADDRLFTAKLLSRNRKSVIALA
jgi:diguanylate cyclase (GGDEF)-like protein